MFDIHVHTSPTQVLPHGYEYGISYHDSICHSTKGVTLVYLFNTVIRWTRLTRQQSKWVDSLYLYDNTHIYACT